MSDIQFRLRTKVWMNFRLTFRFGQMYGVKLWPSFGFARNPSGRIRSTSKTQVQRITVLLSTHMFIHKCNEPYLPLLSRHSALPLFARYSFLVPLRVGDWVGLGDSVKIPKWYAYHLGITRARCRVASLIYPLTLHYTVQCATTVVV